MTDRSDSRSRLQTFRLVRVLVVWLVTVGVCSGRPARLLAQNTAQPTALSVSFVERDGHLLVDAQSVAWAFGWTAKEHGSELLVLCRGGRSAHCVPLRLSGTPHLRRDGRLLVDAEALARLLHVRVQRRGRVLVLTARDNATQEPAPPTSLLDWGPGRGFQVGQTLPDIPLYDMQGREVRFSQFLGKQYILFCWASW